MTAEELEPRDSSTVVVVRDAVSRPEVLMVKRHQDASFGSAYAFPGGVLEAADRNVHEHCAGVSAEQACRVLNLDAGGLDYFSAAIRELFEETGVLLATSNFSGDELDAARTALNAGTLLWDDFVARNNLALRCDRLHYFSFWITPPGLPKRYSTRFFLSAMPADQTASHCGGELTDSCWLPAADVLAARRAHTMKVHYPTRKTLESIAHFDAVDAVLDWARSFEESGVVCDAPARVPAMSP